MEQQNTIGEQLQKRRNALEMTQSDLADKSGVTEEYISKIENGHATNVGADTLSKIATALGLSIALLPSREVVNE